MPQEHRYSALSFRTLLSVLGLLFVFAGAVLGWYLWRSQTPALPEQTPAARGTNLWNEGNMQASREAFMQGKALTSDPAEQARFDIFIASTYAAENPQQTVDGYLAILNNETYPRDSRSFAGALLLSFVQNMSDESMTAYVFSKEPFVGLYREESASAYMNREVAYSRGHHLLVTEYGPNFLSYLTAGGIYAYIYPYVDANVQAVIGPRIPEYFLRGKAMLSDAIIERSVHSSINALALRTLAAYAEEYARLVARGDFGNVGAPDEASIAGEYRRALDYVFAAENTVDTMTKFTMMLRYVAHMEATGTQEAETIRTLAASARTLAIDPAVRRLMRETDESTITIGPFQAYRSALIVLGRSDATLRAMLEENGWDPEMFTGEE